MNPHPQETLRKRFWPAMGLFALLGIADGILLDGPLRLAVGIFLAGLAFKTWIAAYRR
ncbi:MAG: hypothetical protein SFV51_15980 [Bryobacteraceae bacterium]|nr:hypothetical protein [Bryobacteraceae bacterium]